ncbi:E3 ubiquitin-protein ligase TRIM71-like [Ptychodera flava]|uniref:E3 ubiquitin-protein ligase TRIM71-like n=1 Tax=Ptychodera flava TaxID=63121 RepID=UPI003969F3FB
MVTGEVANTPQSEQGQFEGRRIEWKVETFGDTEDLFTLNNPCGLAISDNDLVMCDRDNHRVVVKKRASKQVSYLSFNSRFKLEFMPQDVVILSANNLLIITDRGNQQIVVSDCQCKLVRTFGHEQTNFEPFGIALMVPFVIVSDIAEHRIIKYTTEGEYTAEVGGYGKGYGQFNEPYSVAVNSVNQVIASDFHNHRVQVFNSELKFLYTVGTAESSLGPLRNPYGVDVDSDDNMYVCDFDKHRIVKFTREGQPVCSLFESQIKTTMYIAISKGRLTS